MFIFSLTSNVRESSYSGVLREIKTGRMLPSYVVYIMFSSFKPVTCRIFKKLLPSISDISYEECKQYEEQALTETDWTAKHHVTKVFIHSELVVTFCPKNK